MKYTIVTINYNNACELARTIDSVYNQTCMDYEYIIIDGLSTDNSVDIANSYEEKFASKNIAYTVISEKDNGVYNAMNKGIELAKGEYINFMNSGDRFANTEVLEHIYNKINECDVFYGDSYVTKNDVIVDYIYGNEASKILAGMPFNHQASFVKTKVIKKYKFDEQYKIKADYDLFLQLYLDKKIFKQVYEFIAIYDNGGISSKPNNEGELIQQKYGIEPPKPNKLKEFIRKLVPKQLITLRHKLMRKRNK